MHICNTVRIQVDNLVRSVYDARLFHGLRVAAELVDERLEALRHEGTRKLDGSFHLVRVRDGHDAGEHRAGDARVAELVQKAEEQVVVEDHLRGEEVGARIDLLLQVLDVLGLVWAFGMLLGVAGRADAEVRLKSFAQVIYVIGAVLVISVANWSVTTLFDGKGNYKYIFMMVCYCLYPYIWANLIGMVLSNVLATEEVMIYRLIIGIGWFLTGYLFFFGIISIHEYGLGQCLLTILFTLVAALIILFVGILVFDLFQKIYGFLYQIYQEITMRNLL